MKYLKTFEGRKPAYKFLSTENAEKIDVVVRDFIRDINLSKKIDKLKFDNFSSDSFDYREVFECLLSSGENGYGNGLYGHDNIYYVVDVFKHTNNIPTIELRNSLYDIISKLFKEFDIKNKLEKKLIEVLQRNPDKYKERLDRYEDELSDIVKKACNYMIDMTNATKKYNM